jgi:nicotinamidase/pyrazinamidase
MSKILAVVDMQNDFVSGSLGTKEAAGIVGNVVEKIKTFDGVVVYTRDTHEPDYLSTQEGKNLPVVHCVRGSAGWEIVDEIKQLAEKGKAKVFDKDTFGSKELIDYLLELDAADPIEQIMLVGLCTDICVISNALAIKAFLPEVPIVVDAACCAGVTSTSHDTALEAMKMCQVAVVNG